MEPGALIRAARVRAGLSQAALARRAGTSQPVISAYEHGRRDPGVATLRRLVAAAGERLRLGVEAPVGDLVPCVDAHEHAARLLDVLSLADAVPSRVRSSRLVAPRMSSA